MHSEAKRSATDQHVRGNSTGPVLAVRSTGGMATGVGGQVVLVVSWCGFQIHLVRSTVIGGHFLTLACSLQSFLGSIGSLPGLRGRDEIA